MVNFSWIFIQTVIQTKNPPNQLLVPSESSNIYAGAYLLPAAFRAYLFCALITLRHSKALNVYKKSPLKSSLKVHLN